MQKLVACFLSVLLVAVSIDAQLRGSDLGLGQGQQGVGDQVEDYGPEARRRSLRFLRGVDKDTYEWDVDVESSDADTAVPQKAYVLKDQEVVIFLAFSSKLKDLDMTRSIIYMNTYSGVMIMKPSFRRSPCYVSTISVTKPEIVSDVSAWNGTTTTLTDFLKLDGTERPMTMRKGMEFLKSNAIPNRFCYPSRIVQTKPSTAGVDDAGTKTLTFLGYDSLVSLLVNEGGRRRGRGGWRPTGQRGQKTRGEVGRGGLV